MKSKFKNFQANKEVKILTTQQKSKVNGKGILATIGTATY